MFAGRSHDVGIVAIDVPGLTEPTAMAAEGHRAFVAERVGRVLSFPDGALILDISDRVGSHGIEEGLIGIDVSANAMAVHYTAKDHASTISVFPFGDGRIGPEHVLWRLPDDVDLHNGGGAIIQDDRVIFAIGDGRDDIDPRGPGQPPPYGSILAVPLLGGPTEVLATGLRNPWKISLDPTTGDIWVPDTGRDGEEEINLLRRGVQGADFGWPDTEGRLCRRDCSKAHIEPLAVYPSHVEGRCAIVGGVLYRGQEIPSLAGRYLFADWCAGTIWSIDPRERDQARAEVYTHSLISTFGVTANDEIVFLDINGRVGRLIARDPNVAMPARPSEMSCAEPCP